MASKPVFKISKSLLDGYSFYKNNESKENFENFANAVSGIWNSNFDTDKGERFEQEVYDGKHGKLSEIVKGLQHQLWLPTRYIDFGQFVIKLSGKADAVDKENGIIYDIKRANYLYMPKYETTSQHLIYFYLDKTAKEFHYLIGIGKGEVPIVHHVIKKERPTDEELEKELRSRIREFLTFIHKKGLLEQYKKAYRYEKYSNKK